MTHSSVSRITRLILLLAVVLTVSGWIPFTAPVTINTTPEGASVYKDGELLGTTPYKINMFFSKKTFELRKEGFLDTLVNMDQNSKEHIFVELSHRPVRVSSQPAADVYDPETSQSLGTTPIELHVYAEDHSYILKADGFFDQDIVIGKETQNPLQIELKAKPIITIKTSPADAKIYMVGNDELLGTGSLTLILEKKAGFEIKADRYYSKTINLEPKTQTENITLQAMPYVMIVSNPIGATVKIGGKAIGITPIDKLFEKATPVEFSLDGYLTKTVILDGTDIGPVITLEKVPPQEPAETNAAPAAL